MFGKLDLHIARGGLRPALVIGVPVGFVNVVESKERLFSVCEKHGYLRGEHEYCPFCDEELLHIHRHE